MLLELRIGNLALATDVVLRPGPGLTVLTGETGAGKSLIAGALGLLAGGRADRGLIRRGEDLAWVEAVCDLGERPDLQRLAAGLGLRVAGDGLLVLRRELRREGRGRVLVNGELSSLALLEQLGAAFFAVQSQHQQRELAEPGFARDLLDEVLGLGARRRDVGAALASLREAQALLARRRQEHDLACEQQEIWRYQLEELEAAGLQEGEEEQLAEAIALKRHARDLLESAGSALGSLAEGPSAARDGLGAAIAALRPHAGRSHRLDAALQLLEVAADQAAEAAAELERFLDGFQADPRDLDELQQRKALYEELRRKHRRDLSGLLELRDALAQRIERHGRASGDLEALESALQHARDDLADRCLGLRRARREGAPGVAAAAEAAIRPLSLPDLELSFAVEPRLDDGGPVILDGRACRVDATGGDVVRLLVRTNPGEAAGEVGSIASGGELSRIHLGLTRLRSGDDRPLLRLFDEVDAGLGMDAATPVAWLLRDLAADVQAICITHLPTVAVHGRQHWAVAKSVREGRTSLALRELGLPERQAEIARQLGGEGWRRGDAAAQLAYARELLAAAGQADLPDGAAAARRRGPP